MFPVATFKESAFSLAATVSLWRKPAIPTEIPQRAEERTFGSSLRGWRADPSKAKLQ